MYPGAPELCDRKDNDCDGLTDEDAGPTFYYDFDNDGFGDSMYSRQQCEPSAQWVLDNTDCDDTNPNRFPGNPEVCDGVDNNCDGQKDIGACLSCNPLFFHKSVIFPPQQKNETMVADFIPDNNCTLKGVASAFGYHHFNWINIVVKSPWDTLLICNGNLGLPFFDPTPGFHLFCGNFWADNLDYYWDEINQDGTTPNTTILGLNYPSWTKPTRLRFKDTPSWESLNANNIMKFYTSLVGVSSGNSYDILDTFIWETTFNGTSGGVHSFRNTTEPDPGSGTGGVSVVEENVNIEDFPLAIKQFLASNGAQNIPLPDPVDLDSDNITDDIDNCQSVYNPDQMDSDGDFVGDMCDNCPDTANPEQLDLNHNGIGDACEIAIDIDPKHCPNKLKIKDDDSGSDDGSSGGRKADLKVVILGTQGFDVTTIDINALNINGVAPVKTKIKDVTAPSSLEPCDCEKLKKDKIKDLELKFNSQAILATLGTIQAGDIVTFSLTGNLLGGAGIEGVDCVVIETKGKDDHSSDDKSSGHKHHHHGSDDNSGSGHKKKRK